MNGSQPEVTIVYLTKNGGDDFRRSLEAIFAQHSDVPFEVLVVDSGSVDRTVELASIRGARVVRLAPNSFNYGATKNLAAQQAKGKILVFLSQDNIPASDEWLTLLVEPFSAGAKVVQGPALSESHGFYWWRCGGFFFTSETRRWLQKFPVGLSSCNLAIRKDILQLVPFRAVPMNEDKVLQRDLRAAGFEAMVVPNAPVLHTHVYGPRDLALRLENEGLGWRYADVQYSLLDAFFDILSPRMWGRAWSGLLNGEIRRVHEFLFPLLRPLMVYKGVHFTKIYRWEREAS